VVRESMLSYPVRAGTMRACMCLGALAVCLAAPARAQGGGSATHHTKTLEAGSLIMGRLDRPLCEAQFAVGDTISATFGTTPRAGGMYNSIVTPRFTAVLRRVVQPDKSTAPDFVLEIAVARFGTVRRNDLKALLYLDIESSDSHIGMPPTRCYSSAIAWGDVTRTVRY
jgi:hypothetical protein